MPRRGSRLNHPRTPLILLAAVALLGTSACGSRLSPALRQQAADQALGRSGTTLSPGQAAAGNEAAGSTAGGSAVVGTTSGAVRGPATGTGPSGLPAGAGTGTIGVPVPPEGNGGATDVGVTASTLTVGTIADLSGPVPGLFQGAVAGTQAYVAKVNAEGGLFGRRLKVDTYDSQMDCGQHLAAISKAMAKDFALVGSFSLHDGCGVDELATDPSFADIHNALQDASQTSPNNFSVAPFERGWRLGPLADMKKRHGSRFGHVGSIYASVGGGAERWEQVKAAVEHTGGHVDYDRAYGATETDFTADIIQMRQKGVQMIYAVSVNAAGAANLVKAARAQDVDWPIVFGGPAYDRAFLDQAGRDAEGVMEEQQYALFFDDADARSIPAVAEYQKWMTKTGNGSRMDLFSAYGWGSAELFVRALKAAGPRATRTGVMKQLRAIRSFDTGGLLATSDPAGKHSARCWLLARVTQGRWTRLDTPATGFRCDGGYYLG